MRYLFAFTLLFALIFSCQTKESSDPDAIRIPGEFEPHEAIWLGFRTLESYGSYAQDSVTLGIIRAIHPHVQLNLIVEQDSLAPNALDSLFAKGIDTTHITIVYQSPTDIWYRDPGPVFAVSGSNGLKVIDFKYTGYQNVPTDSIEDWAKEHEAIDREIAQRLEIDTVNSIVAIEGGAFETDGQGTLIQVENITLKRNPQLTKEEIESDFKKCCAIKNVIWLPSGVADDPHNFNRITGKYFGYGTGGHTDEFVRFANDSTILLAWVDEAEKDAHPINQLNYEILSKNFEILSAATNAKGEKYNIIKVPHTDPKTEPMVVGEKWSDEDMEYFKVAKGDTLQMAYASSYLNYLLTNKVIILPQYGDEHGTISTKDEAVKSIFQQLYPNKEIVGINPISLNQYGGGMHCRYQTQPKIN
ncbi:MAG: agmatine deiminase family protein [Bacteroidota bacterium]